MAQRQTWDPERYARHGRFVADLAMPVVELLAPQPGDTPASQQYPSSGDPYGQQSYPSAAPLDDPYGQQPYPSAVPSDDPYGPYAPAPARMPARRRGPRPGAAMVAVLGVGVLLLAVVGIWALSSSEEPRPTPPQGRTSAAAPSTSPIRVAGGYQFTERAARSDTDCAGNAYGKVADFFRTAPCTKLDRALYSSTVDGRIVVVSVSVVQMPTDQAAGDLRKLADTSGTGNVSDLLRAGVRVPEGPESLTDAGYASTQDGAAVVIAEADFADQSVRDEDLLDRISEAALQLRK